MSILTTCPCSPVRPHACDRMDAGDAIQLYGCWMKPGWFGTQERYYWVGGRCAARCHSWQRYIAECEYRGGEFGEILGAMAQEGVAAVAIAHWLGAEWCEAAGGSIRGDGSRGAEVS